MCEEWEGMLSQDETEVVRMSIWVYDVVKCAVWIITFIAVEWKRKESNQWGLLLLALNLWNECL